MQVHSAGSLLLIGHVITPHGQKTSNEHVPAVKEFATLTNVQGVRRFLGLASNYWRFMPSFAKLASPLHVLTWKGAIFIWNSSCQEAFDGLKQRLMRAPVLAYPQFDRSFVLETDASGAGLGAVLSQVQDDGKPRAHPIAFASRAVSPCEKNYSITELETLAVVLSVSHCRSYLHAQEVTVYTDHSAVSSVL